MADFPSAISFPVFEAMSGLQTIADFLMIALMTTLRRDAHGLKAINNWQIIMSGCQPVWL